MVEADFQTQFSRWIKYNLKGSGAHELKMSKNNSVPFNRLEEHQKRALLNAKHSQLCFKPPDLGYQNPCDVLCIKNGHGLVYVMFYVKRGTKHFYEIDIDDWCREESSSPRKSLTEERAKEIGVTHVLA